MVTNKLTIKVCDSVEEAPVYHDKGYKALQMNEAVVVRGGTVAGNDTVDLVFTDAEGNRYVALVTGNILKTLASAINIHR